MKQKDPIVWPIFSEWRLNFGIKFEILSGDLFPDIYFKWLENENKKPQPRDQTALHNTEKEQSQKRYINLHLEQKSSLYL